GIPFCAVRNLVFPAGRFPRPRVPPFPPFFFTLVAAPALAPPISNPRRRPRDALMPTLAAPTAMAVLASEQLWPNVHGLVHWNQSLAHLCVYHTDHEKLS